jgi:hypothetical protein
MSRIISLEDIKIIEIWINYDAERAEARYRILQADGETYRIKTAHIWRLAPDGVDVSAGDDYQLPVGYLPNLVAFRDEIRQMISARELT